MRRKDEDARADFRWLVQAGLIARSPKAWRDFRAGYLAMADFYKARAAFLIHVA